MAPLGKPTAEPFKLLLIGDSGVGKTGALASLANAGYELFILDFDAGTDILKYTVKPEAFSRVHVETLTDKGELSGMGLKQKIIKLAPTAMVTALGLLNSWRDRETNEDFGPVSSWDTKRVLVVDSLTFMGTAALDYALAVNGRSGQQPHQSDWGEGMRLLEQTLQILYSTAIKCHVIVLSHVVYQQPKEGFMRGLPMALGDKLSPKVGRYFNTVLLAKTEGMGQGAKRLIFTRPEGLVEVKCPILNAPHSLPIETALATLLELWNARPAAIPQAPVSAAE